MSYQITTYPGGVTKNYFSREQALKAFAKHGTGRKMLVAKSERGIFRNLTGDDLKQFIVDAVGPVAKFRF